VSGWATKLGCRTVAIWLTRSEPIWTFTTVTVTRQVGRRHSRPAPRQPGCRKGDSVRRLTYRLDRITLGRCQGYLWFDDGPGRPHARAVGEKGRWRR
jgi:hypothetical protein